jgi:exo-beta-1,3-glucanase (GH17 family)
MKIIHLYISYTFFDYSFFELFYFSSFDESWKVGPEGEVGAHWGLWDKNETLKY